MVERILYIHWRLLFGSFVGTDRKKAIYFLIEMNIHVHVSSYHILRSELVYLSVKGIANKPYLKGSRVFEMPSYT